MGDRAWTTVLAWPYPGREQLPQAVRDDLDTHGLLPESDEAFDGEWYGEGGSAVLAGDQQSGPILALVDEEANCGVEAFRELITALCAAGLYVFAGNEAGDDYCGSWEYDPPGAPGETISEWRQWERGEFVVCADGLLTQGRHTLDEIPDDELAAGVRYLLSPPPAIPAAVLEQAPCCF